jgi:alkylhydroperoxidase family enzyme
MRRTVAAIPPIRKKRLDTMARVAPAEPPLAPAAQEELDRQLAAHGRVTQMKRTLAHSPRALIALMEWYPLRDEVAAFLGERLTTLFAHAVSTETDCLICSTFFRRVLIEAGEDPDSLRLDAREQAIVDYGLALTRDCAFVPEATYAAAARHLTPAQMVALTAFGGMMIATNVFNNAMGVDLDDYLQTYRRPGAVKDQDRT